ncbi:MAG TPA: ABC transporter substrate-binding protein [Streptosporangiaceae bacterium]|nr:ABC transporter substrate-binding protein [Streptosporangiaceae bacterium]
MKRNDGSGHTARSRARRVHAITAAALVMAAGLAACSSSSSSSSSSTSAAASSPRPSSKYPVTVTSCGVPVTYDRAPQRAVSNDINTTEDMLALGLESHMVGTFGAVGDGPVGQPIPPQYQAGFSKVHDADPDNYFTLEELIALRPDFLFAGWNYGLQTGTDDTPAYLAKFGIKTLVLAESCAHVQSGINTVSINDTYQDLRNLGAIFGVQARAQQVIAGMQAQVAAVRAKVGGLKPVTVFDYDSGQSAPFTGPGLAEVNALISLAGGTNIFGSLMQSWTSVSWEQVVRAQPQCIIINNYGTPTVPQKIKFLETFAASKNLPAVKNHCFLPLSYDEVTPSPRNAEAVLAIAQWLHPSAFGLPADGS